MSKDEEIYKPVDQNPDWGIPERPEGTKPHFDTPMPKWVLLSLTFGVGSFCMFMAIIPLLTWNIPLMMATPVALIIGLANLAVGFYTLFKK